MLVRAMVLPDEFESDPRYDAVAQLKEVRESFLMNVSAHVADIEERWHNAKSKVRLGRIVDEVIVYFQQEEEDPTGGHV